MPVHLWPRRKPKDEGQSSDSMSRDASPAVQKPAPARSPRPSISSTDGEIDYYPYTFSPLLLFAPEGYFDMGHSNYNSVAQFFASALPEVNMLENVLYERKNMLYEELLSYVTSQRMLVICCIESHFTAFQILSDTSLIYYDPLKPWLHAVGKDGFKRFVTWHLLKCSYGDNQHLAENKNHYVGHEHSNSTRRMIYELWRNINKVSFCGVPTTAIGLNLGRYLLVNNPREPARMSTQLTSNTCYFQSYLFGVLCKLGRPELAADGEGVDVPCATELEEATLALCRRLLGFFDDPAEGLLRPLTNCNVVLDFRRYLDSAYFPVIRRYLCDRSDAATDHAEYEEQYSALLGYFEGRRLLHTYGRLTPSGEMSAAPNTKCLQPVCDTDEGAWRLGRGSYYKYRAASLMFGFNVGITNQLRSFCEFNALRKNQLLASYDELRQHFAASVGACRTTNQYRDYYFMAQFEVRGSSMQPPRTHHAVWAAL